MPKIKEAELKKLKTELPILEEKCIELEANYTKVNSSGFEKSKKFRDEKDVLAPEELKLQKLVGCKQNQVISKILNVIIWSVDVFIFIYRKSLNQCWFLF